LVLTFGTMAFGSALAAHDDTAQVPVVACASDGQTGPIDPPDSLRPGPNVPRALDGRLAYYESDSMGVFGPVGWHCFRTYGSSGESLFVTPDAHGSEFFFGASPKLLTGPAIQLGISYGGTSGRFSVAAVAARVFPVAKRFVNRVIAEGLELKKDFPSGPYPSDKLTRLSPTKIEFSTPAHRDGFGTHSWLEKNDAPIDGVLILSGDEDERDLVQLNVRLGADMRDLISTIVHEAEDSTERPSPPSQ